MNHLWKVWSRDNEEDAIVVKIFGAGKGQGTETPFTVEEEHELMEELNDYKLTPPLLAV